MVNSLDARDLRGQIAKHIDAELCSKDIQVVGNECLENAHRPGETQLESKCVTYVKQLRVSFSPINERVFEELLPLFKQVLLDFEQFSVVVHLVFYIVRYVWLVPLN